MSHNQDLAKTFNGLVLGGKIKLVQNSCNFSVIHFVIDLEHIPYSPDWGPHTQDLSRERVSGLFNLLSTKKVNVILIVVVESTHLHCKEVCEYMY